LIGGRGIERRGLRRGEIGGRGKEEERGEKKKKEEGGRRRDFSLFLLSFEI